MSDRSASLDEILRNLSQGWIMEADAPVLLAHLDELRARAERAEVLAETQKQAACDALDAWISRAERAEAALGESVEHLRACDEDNERLREHAAGLRFSYSVRENFHAATLDLLGDAIEERDSLRTALQASERRRGEVEAENARLCRLMREARDDLHGRSVLFSGAFLNACEGGTHAKEEA